MTYPENTNKEIALNACKYAREYILKGITQLVNNTFDEAQRAALNQAVFDLRDKAEEYGDYELEFKNILHKFYKTIELCKKFSLGNCGELTLMALDYVVNYAPETINAESYYIVGGDHVFLVVGRDPDSDPKKPETWGEHAYICDPWSNAVYHASEYQTKTKNYYRIVHPTGDYTNYIQDFNPDKHSLEPHCGYSATEIRTAANAKEHLQEIIDLFEKRLALMQKAMEVLENNLNELAEKLEKRYGKDDPKRMVILKLLEQLKKARLDVKERFNSEQYNKNYLNLRKQLEEGLSSSVKSYITSVTLSREEQGTLIQYHPNFKAILMRFFGIFPKTALVTNQVVDQANNAINEALNQK
jgi:hypothetical protein